MSQHRINGEWREVTLSSEALRVMGACEALDADDGRETIVATLLAALDSITDGESVLIARAARRAVATLEEGWDLSEEAVSEALNERDKARADLASLKATLAAMGTAA